MRSLLEIQAEIEQRGFTLRPYAKEDYREFYAIFREVIEAGSYFPHEEATTDEMKQCFFASNCHVYVCHSQKEGVVGGFYIKANFPGRGQHIANAAYMVRSSSRGKGLGKLLGEASLSIAKELGFLAMQFNVVLSQNERAIALYKKLGFSIIGTIPEAIRNKNGSFQTGYILHRYLQ